MDSFHATSPLSSYPAGPRTEGPEKRSTPIMDPFVGSGSASASSVSPSLTSRGSDASSVGLPSNFLFLLLIKAEAVSAAVRFEVARVLLTEDIAGLGGLALLSTK